MKVLLTATGKIPEQTGSQIMHLVIEDVYIHSLKSKIKSFNDCLLSGKHPESTGIQDHEGWSEVTSMDTLTLSAEMV